MPSQVLAPCEAQVAWWIVSAVEALGLLLLIRSCSICVHALAIGAGTIIGHLSIRVVHVYVQRVSVGRLGVLRAVVVECILGRLSYGRHLGKRTRRQGSLAGHVDAVKGRSGWRLAIVGRV